VSEPARSVARLDVRREARRDRGDQEALVIRELAGLTARIEALEHALGLPRTVPIRSCAECGFALPQLRSPRRRQHGVETCPVCGCRSFWIVRRERWPQ
jgi:hypothetical protein